MTMLFTNNIELLSILTVVFIFFSSSPLIAAMKEYKRVYEHILESEKKLDQARKDLVNEKLLLFYAKQWVELQRLDLLYNCY